MYRMLQFATFMVSAVSLSAFMALFGHSFIVDLCKYGQYQLNTLNEEIRFKLGLELSNL